MDKERLAAGGFDVEDGLSRVMGNETLYARLLGMFAPVESASAVRAAIDANDARIGEEASHALKGTAGNLSAVDLFRISADQCELFRAGDMAGAAALMDDLESAAHAAQAAIDEALR